MKVISKSELEQHKSQILSQMKSGSIFIHPTDTIYGLGCNALINNAVKKIRDIKERPTLPFSVIVPSVAWIRQHCIVPPQAEEYLEKLPGPYTLVFKLKTPGFFSEEINQDTTTIGVRFPHHWISQLVAELGYPIVTTSVNVQGRQFMTSYEDIMPEIEQNVAFMIDEGEKYGRPSTVVRFDTEEVDIHKR